MHVRESWKADLDCHGVRTERPYPPCSMKVNSSLRTSRMSRSSLAITVNLHSSISLAAAICCSCFPVYLKNEAGPYHWANEFIVGFLPPSKIFLGKVSPGNARNC